MKTAISIPDELFESAERLAEQQGLSRSELYVTALRKFLKEQRHIGVTEQLDAIYGEEPSALAAELIGLQSRSLPKDDW
jgi:metal-responsive CopG/Arc/MetJ family transcriptional regulator